MALLEKIDADLLVAFKGGDQAKKETLRYLKSALKNAEIELGTALSDHQIIEVISREAKKRRESIEAYRQAGKEDLAKQEAWELTLLEQYLPSQMNEEQISDFITKFLEKNPNLLSNKGLLMKELVSQLKGKADMALVAKIVSRILGDA